MTKYLILEEVVTQYEDAAFTVGEISSWNIYAENIEASSAVSALRKALNGRGDLGNRYVAVPMRSWNPQPIEVETQHRLRIG